MSQRTDDQRGNLVIRNGINSSVGNINQWALSPESRYDQWFQIQHTFLNADRYLWNYFIPTSFFHFEWKWNEATTHKNSDDVIYVKNLHCLHRVNCVWTIAQWNLRHFTVNKTNINTSWNWKIKETSFFKKMYVGWDVVILSKYFDFIFQVEIFLFQAYVVFFSNKIHMYSQ